MKTLEDIQSIVNRINLGELYDRPRFRLLEKGDGFLLQLTYMEANTDAPGPSVIQKARKWYVSSHSTETEIVRTAYKAVLASLEHRLGEHFRYNGQKVYSPHFIVHDLQELSAGGRFDSRDKK